MYCAAVVPHAFERPYECCERHTMFVHCAGRTTTCGKHRMHSVHANRACFVRVGTHDNAHQTWTRVTPQYNKTALMWAAIANALDVAKLLTDKGSDVNARDQV